MSKHRPFQARTIDRCRKQNLLLAHGCGVGKTREGMWALAQKPGPALILAPVSVLETVWMEHYKRWLPKNMPILLWDRSPSMQQKLLNQHHRVYLTSFESAKPRYYDLQNKRFNTILIDESSKVRNYSTQTAGMVLAFAGLHKRGCKYKLGRVIPHRYAMSGTPDPNSELDWWTQVKFVAGNYGGFHPNYYRFREKYFIRNEWTRSWSFRNAMFDEFHSEMAPWVDVIKTEDVLPDLETAVEIRHVQLCPKERKAYKEMHKLMIAILEDENVPASNALHQALCLREITSGFLYKNDHVHKLGNTKLSELQSLLDEIGNNRTIIWYHYEYEKQAILKALGTKARWQEKPGQRRVKVLEDFRANKFQYLVANPASIKFGDNLQFCHHMIFFSISASYDNYEQCMRRIVRDGQKFKCMIYFLIAKQTYDERLLKLVQDKEKRSHKSLDYFRR